MTKLTSQEPKIAYLLSHYPAISHTFFLNEVLEMRRNGFVIETASVNSIEPPPGGFPRVEMQEAAGTFYIKECRKGAILAVILRTLVTYPAVILRGLRAALRLRPFDIPGTGYAIFYLLEAIILGDWMLRKNCTHLHVHFGGPVSTVGMLTSIAWGIPYSLTIHGPEEFYDVVPSFLEEKVRLAKFVTCISHFCRSQLLKIAPVESWEKFHVCRLGVQTGVFLPVENGGRKTLHIVSVGRLHPAKGQMILLASFRELVRRGMNLRLSIVGDGAGLADLRRFIAANSLGDSVTLHGSLSHPATRELLGTADLFVLPSFAEGVPVALMEAMSMRIACISTFVAGIPELIESGTDGVLVAPSSEEALTEAMASLLVDNDLRQRIAAAGRDKVLAKYDLGVNIKQFVSAFEQYGLSSNASHERLGTTSEKSFTQGT